MRKKRLVSFAPAFDEKMVERSIKYGISVSELVRRAMEEYFRRHR